MGAFRGDWRESTFRQESVLTMETELWICPECLEKYDIKEKRVLKIGTGAFVSEQKMGICPMCHEYRNLIKAEPLKESGTKPELDNEEVECQPMY